MKLSKRIQVESGEKNNNMIVNSNNYTFLSVLFTFTFAMWDFSVLPIIRNWNLPQIHDNAEKNPL